MRVMRQTRSGAGLIATKCRNPATEVPCSSPGETAKLSDVLPHTPCSRYQSAMSMRLRRYFSYFTFAAFGGRGRERAQA
jgi:hypothetical protein